MIQRVGIRPPWNDFDMLRAYKEMLNFADKCGLRTKKQYRSFVRSMTDLLLRDKMSRETVLETCGDCAIRLSPEGEVLEIADSLETLEESK